MIVGYARTSIKYQNLSKQVQELKEFGCDKIYLEKQSGKNLNRPVYREMRSKLKFGDVLVVNDLRGLGRSKEEIKDEWEYLIRENIDIVVLNIPILDTRRYKEFEEIKQLVSDLFLSIFNWMVEDEKLRIRTAQREGIEIAKSQGKFRGGKKKYHKGATGKEKVLYDEVVRCLNRNVSVMDIHRKTGLSRNTIYAIKRELQTTESTINFS